MVVLYYKSELKNQEAKYASKLKKLEYISNKIQDKKANILENIWFDIYYYNSIFREHRDQKEIKDKYDKLIISIRKQSIFIEEELLKNIYKYIELIKPILVYSDLTEVEKKTIEIRLEIIRKSIYNKFQIEG